jgi:hypothetical protein
MARTGQRLVHEQQRRQTHQLQGQREPPLVAAAESIHRRADVDVSHAHRRHGCCQRLRFLPPVLRLLVASRPV